ncbi:MAG: tRNA uridine-5-carboxymethylaminomethyl(34) synthesis GTPase MnmE [Phascolarctobacterium sp.]|nr:tRNA uridine-5-carboxymethylaminomethyl(34) synthesis GTPase MnmE [Phascolarctobacterium sp.]MBQ7020995.1 tRNA uridine-5-carboxymethylaminomethyl(34) synthesis GTPase MnmE [Phascolarctobacterium sp.]
MQEETISAVITALGEGAVGIVRISGENALAVGEKMFRAASGKKLEEYAPNTLVYGHVYEEDSLIDEVLAVYMKAPRSYTAEDVVEIQCHGGVQSLKKILELSYKEGARPAEPGEFTKRAFLNGRIDLTQAEAVMDIIKSRSEASLKLAVRQQNGQLAKALRSLRTDLVDIIVNLEAVIDYPEEDIEDVTFGKVQESISTSCEKIENLLAHAHTGKILREGLRTAIVGRPNVGKSSLLNALLKEDRAIVSEYAGTTRDVIEEQLLLDGVPLVLADTAGIRQTDDFVEAIGVERSKQHLQDAELVICVVDGSVPLTPEDEDILEAAQAKPFVIIVNKSDKDINDNFLALQERFGKEQVMALSAKTTQGIDEFTSWLKNFVYGSEGALSDGVYVQNARHEQLLREALGFLEDAGNAAENMLPYDCIVIDVRNAIDLLGEITGDTVQDEIINQIFSRFCIGK